MLWLVKGFAMYTEYGSLPQQFYRGPHTKLEGNWSHLFDSKAVGLFIETKHHLHSDFLKDIGTRMGFCSSKPVPYLYEWAGITRDPRLYCQCCNGFLIALTCMQIQLGKIDRYTSWCLQQEERRLSSHPGLLVQDKWRAYIVKKYKHGLCQNSNSTK